MARLASPRGGITRPTGRLVPGAGDVPWLVLIALAVLLPIGWTTRWLHPTYGTTPEDLHLGVGLLKASLVVLAVAGLAIRRMPAGSAEDASPAPTAGDARWIVVAIVTGALALRSYHLGTELWLDEIEMLVRYVPLEFRQLASTYDSQNHHPLYTILARLSWLAFGGAEWALRVPAVLFGVASLVALRAFVRTIVPPVEATLASVVLAVSYHHVWFSQNARGYTAILLFGILSTWLFLRVSRTGSPRLAWGYGLAMAVATYTHLTAAAIAVGHLLALLATMRSGDRDRGRELSWPLVALALSALISVALYSLMLPQLVRQLATPATAASTPEWTSTRYMAAEALRAMGEGVPGGIATVLVAVSVLAVGVGSLWRRDARATLAMYVPVAVTAAALVATGHNLWPRFFFFAAGFLVLAAIRGGFVLVSLVPSRHSRRVAIGGASAVAALSLTTVPRAWEPKQQFRAAHDFVESQRQPGDAAVALDIVQNVYLLRGWSADWVLTRSPTVLADVERTAGRTWIVYTLPPRLRTISPELWERVSSSHYQHVRVFPATVGGGEMHVLRFDATRDD